MTTEDSKALLRFHIEEAGGPVGRRGQDSIAFSGSTLPAYLDCTRPRARASRGEDGGPHQACNVPPLPRQPASRECLPGAHGLCVQGRSCCRGTCGQWRRSGFLHWSYILQTYSHQIEPISIRSFDLSLCTFHRRPQRSLPQSRCLMPQGSFLHMARSSSCEPGLHASQQANTT